MIATGEKILRDREKGIYRILTYGKSMRKFELRIVSTLKKAGAPKTSIRMSALIHPFPTHTED